jgi:hypothetical protein
MSQAQISCHLTTWYDFYCADDKTKQRKVRLLGSKSHSQCDAEPDVTLVSVSPSEQFTPRNREHSSNLK